MTLAVATAATNAAATHTPSDRRFLVRLLPSGDHTTSETNPGADSSRPPRNRLCANALKRASSTIDQRIRRHETNYRYRRSRAHPRFVERLARAARDQARDGRSGSLDLGQKPQADGRGMETGDRRPRDRHDIQWF